jgi:hypothetical protein
MFFLGFFAEGEPPSPQGIAKEESVPIVSGATA